MTDEGQFVTEESVDEGRTEDQKQDQHHGNEQEGSDCRDEVDCYDHKQA